MNKERDIVEQAVLAFNADKAIEMRISAKKPQAETWDAVAVIRINNIERGVRAQVKKWVNHANRGALIRQLNQFKAQNENDETILVTDYVNPNLAKILKKENINYIDTAGNALLYLDPVYIDIQGRKPIQKEQEKITGATIQPKGLKVVYILLAHQEMLNAGFRNIANAANVALGTVKNVFDDLKAQRYIAEDKGNKRYWLQKQKLLDLWVNLYPQKIKAKHRVERFEARTMFWYKEIPLGDYGAFLGGEAAAAALTNYLTPGITQVYVDPNNIGVIAGKAHLRRARDGHHKEYEVEFLEPFVNRDYMMSENTAHPLVIYANLIDIDDPRTTEVAELIYERFLDKP